MCMKRRVNSRWLNWNLRATISDHTEHAWLRIRYIAEYFESVIFHVNYLSYLPVFLCLYCTLNQSPHFSAYMCVGPRGAAHGWTGGVRARSGRQAIVQQSQRLRRVLDHGPLLLAPPAQAATDRVLCVQGCCCRAAWCRWACSRAACRGCPWCSRATDSRLEPARRCEVGARCTMSLRSVRRLLMCGDGTNRR